MQIVLNESLNVAPKLTNEQIATLSLIYLFRYTQSLGLGTHELLAKYLDETVLPYHKQLGKNAAWYQHLEFAGCGAISVGEIKLAQIIGNNYQGLFLKGFESMVLTQRNISIGQDDRFFIQCLNNPDLLQVKALNKEGLTKELDSNKISPTDQTEIKYLFGYQKMNDEEVQKKCISLRPYMSEVFDVWDNSYMKNFTLTSVGIAIAHANIKRILGKEFADLSIWIN